MPSNRNILSALLRIKTSHSELRHHAGLQKGKRDAIKFISLLSDFFAHLSLLIWRIASEEITLKADFLWIRDGLAGRGVEGRERLREKDKIDIAQFSSLLWHSLFLHGA
jgi:hypothetical protein